MVAIRALKFDLNGDNSDIVIKMIVVGSGKTEESIKRNKNSANTLYLLFDHFRVQSYDCCTKLLTPDPPLKSIQE